MLSLVVSAILLAAGIAVVSQRVNWRDMVAVWSNLDLKLVALACLAYWLQYPVNSIRLQRVILWATSRVPREIPPFRFLFKLTCSAGFVAAAAPIGLAGDAAKIAALRLFGSLSITEATRCALFDRAVGVQWICLIGLATLPLQRAAGMGRRSSCPSFSSSQDLSSASGCCWSCPPCSPLCAATLSTESRRCLPDIARSFPYAFCQFRR